MESGKFDLDEMSVLFCFDTESRAITLQAAEHFLSISQDDELRAILIRSVEKLRSISDEEFSELDFDYYRIDEYDADIE